MSDKQLAVLEPQQIINVAESALSIDQIVKQRELITSCMARAMKENQHYGKVPGCGEKPTLLQPGAQLLAHLFRLRPEYEIIDVDLPNGHKRFRVTCRLFFIGSQPEIKIAEGVGESSSMESKHRFRNAAAIITPTGDPVPSTYWDIKNKSGPDAAKQWAAKTYEGKNVSTKKIDGAWQFVIVEGGSDEKIENANPADVFNTVLKIAKKRAFVDATITATASSDFFTQDLEDIRDNIEAVTKAAPVEEKRANATEQPSGVTNWRDVECTFGKKSGPLRGKKLGELNPSNLKYLAEMFLVEGKEIAQKDRKMVAGLAMWKGEASGKGGSNDDLPKFNGKNHEELYERLVWEKVDINDFMTAMKKAKLLPETANNFANMSDETAAKFLPEFDDTVIPLVRKES